MISRCCLCGSVSEKPGAPCGVCYSPALFERSEFGPVGIVGATFTRSARPSFDAEKSAVMCATAVAEEPSEIAKIIEEFRAEETGTVTGECGKTYIGPRKLEGKERLGFLVGRGKGERKRGRSGATKAITITVLYHVVLLLVSALLVNHEYIGEEILGLQIGSASRELSVDDAQLDDESEDQPLETPMEEDFDDAPSQDQSLNEVAPIISDDPAYGDVPGSVATPERNDYRPNEHGKGGWMPLKERPRDDIDGAGSNRDSVRDSGATLATVNSFANRKGDARLRALSEYGGGAEVLDAVEAALAFLSRYQLADGSWSTTGARYRGELPLFQGAGSVEGADVGITALSMLAFMGAGYSAEDGQYADNIERGLQWLIDHQEPNGAFDQGTSMDASMRSYNTVLATLAMCEACVMHPDNKRYRKAATKGLTFFVRSQNRNGGWSYYSMPGSSSKRDPRSDTSISGWVVLAINIAREAGIKVKATTVAGLDKLFQRMTDPDTGETIYADLRPHVGRRGIGLVGVGLAVRRILNPQRYENVDRLALTRLQENAPAWNRLRNPTASNGRPNFDTMYGWYYSTVGAFMATGGKGEDWQKWNEPMKRTLVDNQEQSGIDAGSWAPDETWLGGYYGRLYTTTMACLTLETYFRYSPKPERVLSESADVLR